MKNVFFPCLLVWVVPLAAWSHDLHADAGSGMRFTEELRRHIADEFMAKRMALAKPGEEPAPKPLITKRVQVAAGALDLSMLALGSTLTPPGNAALMVESFAPFKPKVRYWWDANYFYEESDGIPDRSRQPDLMVGITAWQQQIPVPLSYFLGTTNGTNNAGSLGYQQPNVWKIPLVPVPAASPIPLDGNFLRGAVALGADGVPIFNPRNNRGEFSWDIGELDTYGGHCGLADDYHYHIFPVHLTPVLGDDKPIAWALDGYPVYGYVEPDGSPMQPLDADGGHDHGGWGYHYHARGTFNSGTGKWVPANPFMMNAMHGVVVNFDSQIDPQPTAGNMRSSPSGGYEAKVVPGAEITAFKNPVALATDGGGHLIEDPTGTPSADQWLMRYTAGGVTYDLCWRLNRTAVPRSMTITWRHPTTGTTTTTYTGANATSRITAYPMAPPSMAKLPDTSQTVNATGSPGDGEDSDYTRNPQSFTNHGNGTITDNVTGLMWQSVDNGESTWEVAVANSASVATGGYSDWRLPTPSELFSLFNHSNSNPALDTAYFPDHPAGAAQYWWTSDLFGASTTSVWCGNAGGGLGPKPKSETLSAGGSLRYHARYVRGQRPTNAHNYCNNNDGTITDLDTGLMWQQVPGAAMTWSDALAYAENLSLAGFSDWRMPNVKELETLTDYTLATFTSTTGIKPSFHRQLFPSATATTYWTSTSQRNNNANAWVVEFGVNTASSPPRNAQGIISQDAKTATYPVFAVRTADLVSRSVTQGLATTTTANLLPAGQRVSAVGSITATDGSVWTVPSATQFTTGAKAPDLYNEVNGVTPANIGAVDLNEVPTVVVDPDGEVVTGYIFADNYFELYVNGVLVGVDPVPFTPFNSCVVKFQAKKPITYAVKLVDWEENLGVGSELNGGNPYHPGDGGFCASFSDGTVTNSQWKAQSFYIAPLNDPGLVVEQEDGTHDSSASGLQTPTLNENSYALHYAIPSNWMSAGFNDALWPNASTYSEATVGVDNKPAYTNFPAQFTNSGAQFIWSSNLVLDNEVIVRFTGPPAQHDLAVEQPANTGLTDNVSTVNYGDVEVGSLATRTFVIRNNGSAALTVGAVSFDGANASDFTVTTAPATTLAAGASTTMVVQFAPASAGTKSAAMHIASSDASFGPAFDVNLAGTGTLPPPAIGLVSHSPAVPGPADSPRVTAAITPAGGATVTSAQLTYSTGSQSTNTVFNETMASVPTPGGSGGWDQAASPATYPWTVVTANGNGNVKQTNNANHTPAGQGGTCGLEMSKGSPTLVNSVTTTNSIDASGSAGYVEFWATANTVSSAGLGWSFQLSTDGGATWADPSTGQITEFAVANHGFQKYHYDLQPSERVSTLKMRFNFFGNGTGGAGGSKVQFDDITVVTTSGAAPVMVAMLDDGAHGDGAAGDGVYGAQIPPQSAGTTVTYSVSATDSNGQTTILDPAGSYTTNEGPVITSASPLPEGLVNTAYSQVLAASGGTPGYAWGIAAGALPTGLSLGSGGEISGTPSVPGTFNFTARVTDGAGRVATRDFELVVNASVSTAPNIVIILTDDQGWGDIGYHTPAGQIPIQTPRMDGLLDRGIRLENFYATTVCSVTRATLMTGRNQLRTGVNNTHGLALSEHIMPQTFKAAGYQTFMCGKWHIGGSDKNLGYTTVNGQSVRVIQEGTEYAPYNRGWDSHYGQYSGAIQYSTHHSNESLNPDVPDWWLNGVQQTGPSEQTDSQGHGGYSTDLLADKAVSHIQNRDPSKPMLLWLAFNAIHGPVSAPQEYLDKYAAIADTKRRTIAAAVDCMDAAIGRVLDQLTASGIDDNTIVVFMSDNGGQESGGSLNDPLRGTKGDSWDGGVHMPAAISWPGVLATQVISRQYVWVGDIFPTLCTAAGVTPQNAEPFDGLDLWPALLSVNASNPDGQPRPLDKPLVTINAAPIALNRFTDPVNGGEKMFKLIRNRSGQTIVNELYNMTDDVDPATGVPIESTDLLLGPNAAAYDGIVASLTTAITDITPINYPPYIGPPLITNTVSEGGNITLYAPFSSWPKTAPTVQWRKNGVNIPGGTFSPVSNVDDVIVAGGYAAKLDLTGVTLADAADYDVVITNAGGTTVSSAGTLTVIPASGAPSITDVSTGPTAPTFIDPVWVRARVAPGEGASLTRVQLHYDTGAPVIHTILRETMAIAPPGGAAWDGTGALNPWIITANRAGGDVRQAVGTANHTNSFPVTNCATTGGSTTVSCDSSEGLWPGMTVTGPNLPAAAAVASVTDATTFELTAPAAGSGSGLSLTAAGAVIANASTTSGSTAITCDTTIGLVSGMSISGSALQNNSTISSITDGTTFVVNRAANATAAGITLVAEGCGLEFQNGTGNPLDTMATLGTPIDATGTEGYIEFYVQTRDMAATNNGGWTLQLSTDGGSTWNTRAAESYDASTVVLANCTLAAGSPTVVCDSTSGLTSGLSVQTPTVYAANCNVTSGSTTITCPDTTGLDVGMFARGSGIPNNARIVSLVSNVSFDISAAATGNAPATNLEFNHLPANATVSGVTDATTFTLNTSSFYSGSGLQLGATSINHGFQWVHYDLQPDELIAGLRLRFQYAGYVPPTPTRSPKINIDDILVATTSSRPPVTLDMFDDGLHGDGLAGDGIFGVQIPVQNGGATVNYTISAADSHGGTVTSPAGSSYTYTVNPALTDATIKGAEFLGMPKDTSMTLNMVFTVDQEMFVEFGTTPGSYPFATTPALYSVDGAKPEFFNPAEVTIQGLQPDTEYYYRVRHRAPGAPFFNARGERRFHTARPRGSTFSFTVTADPHIDVNTDMQLFWRTMQNISLDGPDIHVDIGDIFMTDKLADGLLGVPPRYKGGQPLSQATLNERAVFFRNQFERACHSIPFFFTLGNHEAEYGYLFNNASDKQNNVPAWDLKSRKAFYPTPVPDAFYTGNPTPKDYTGGTLGLLEDFYAFEWGDALFIVLDPFWNVTTNPNQADDAWEWTLGKPQYDWLRDTLKNSSARYKFVFMHHIVGGSTQQANGTPQFAARGGIEVSDKYEWGGKNADGSPGFATKRPGWDMPIHDLLVKNKVSVVFHGHDHFYGYQTKDGVVYLECPQPGTPNFTGLGSAADGQYVDLGANSSSQLYPNSGHVRVTVGRDEVVADYVRSYRTASDLLPPGAVSVFNDESASRHNRDIAHSFVLRPAVMAPIEVANIGPGQVGLRWNAIPNKPYEIQWTTDLKTWTTIDTLTFTNTHTNATYTDTLPARVNGQRAFYRVRYTP